LLKQGTKKLILPETRSSLKQGSCKYKSHFSETIIHLVRLNIQKEKSQGGDMRVPTEYINRNRIFSIALFAIPLILFAYYTPESFSQQEDRTGDDKYKRERTLHFTDRENGNKVEYEVHFKDGEIESIYKNGSKVPENEIEDYEDLVYDELSSMKRDRFDFFVHPGPHAFHFDMDEFRKNMDSMKQSFKNFNFKFDKEQFEFDSQKFKEDMEKLKEELKDADDLVIHIDGEKIRKNIEKELKHLDKLKLHSFDFDVDVDELDENMKRITIELQKKGDEFQLDMERLQEEMEDLNEEMEDLSAEMEKLDKDMKKLDMFLKAAKSELVKDGLIKSEDEEFELELSDDKMEVNDKKVPDELFEKYKSLYKEHYGEDIKGKIRFQN